MNESCNERKKLKKGEGEEEGREFPFEGGRGNGRGEFSKGSARAHKRRAEKPRETRVAALPSCAFSHAHGHFCV